MAYQKSELYFLFILLAGVSVLTFFIFQPFLYALLLAVIFATVFSSVHKKILALMRNNHTLAALLATALVLVVIVVPVVFISIQIFKEATQLYSSILSSGGTTSLLQDLETVAHRFGVSFFSVDALDLGQYAKQSLGWIVQHLDTVFSRVSMVMIDIFVLLIALFYLFRDGHKLKKTAIALSPLQDVYDETIFRKLELAINSVVRGNIFVGLIQGMLTAIGLTIFGVPNPILWGSITAVAALVPGFGTSLVLVPAVLFLFFTGATTAATGLLVWWVLAVAIVDNILGPKLVGHGAQLHPFLILISVLGGVSFFGPLGFLFGPLSLSLLFASLEVYSFVRKERASS